MKARPGRDGSVTVTADSPVVQAGDDTPDVEKYKQVLSSSSAWGRLYRAPAKGHLGSKYSMWMCVPGPMRPTHHLPPEQRAKEESTGGLQQLVVMVPGRMYKAPIDKSAFQLASRMAWGDLWPPFMSVKRDTKAQKQRNALREAYMEAGVDYDGSGGKFGQLREEEM